MTFNVFQLHNNYNNNNNKNNNRETQNALQLNQNKACNA